MLFALLALFAALFAASSPDRVLAQAREPYQIGPLDRINLRVVGWNEATGSFADSFESWDVVNGEYVVDEEGALTIPLAGRIFAEGFTVNNLAESVAIELQLRLNLIEAPSVSIQISQFRPIYLIGDVERPGAYEFSPGITPIRALAVAGGARRLRTIDATPDEIRALRDIGALAELRLEIARRGATIARYEAELDRAAEVVFPYNLTHPGGSGATEAMFEAERVIFRTRREALGRGLRAFEDLRTLINAQIEGLETKTSSQEAQIELVRRAVGDIQELADKGLARAPTLLAQQSALIDLENKQVDLRTRVFEARQALSELERDALDLQARRDTEAAAGLQTERAKLEQLRERERTVIATLELSGVLMDEEDVRTTIEYTLIRSGPDGEIQRPIGRSEPLQPLDVVEVTVSIETGPAIQ